MDVELQKKSEELFNAMYDAHVDAVYRLCVYKTSNRHIAEDLVQDVFVKVFKYIESGKVISNPKAFVFQVARNLIIDYYRKKKTSSLDELQESGFEAIGYGEKDVENKAELRLAIDVIHRLDDKYKDVVYLRLVEDMTMKEVGESLGISANNATVRFHRGVKQLEKLLDNQEEL